MEKLRNKVETKAPSQTTPRALIADDQPEVLEALRLLLKGEGIHPITVSSPAAILEALRSQHFDIVLMDLNYARDTTSGKEGLDLLTEIQEVDKTLPVVVVTGWGSVDLAVEAMRRGVQDFVQKPWENERLVYANAGHDAPILMRQNGSHVRLREGGAVLGVFADWSYEQNEIEFVSGDRVLLFTDGVTEVRNSDGEEFGERRLIDLLKGIRHLGARELQAQVMRTVAEFSGGEFQDDATLIAMSAD